MKPRQDVAFDYCFDLSVAFHVLKHGGICSTKLHEPLGSIWVLFYQSEVRFFEQPAGQKTGRRT